MNVIQIDAQRVAATVKGEKGAGRKGKGTWNPKLFTMPAAEACQCQFQAAVAAIS